ncbi:hypothetical protein CJ030_MR1G008765 [Morella rubra]|uniref:Uncharacterized protein n=1 Tax=Morella rubra TaxID=262757 RepID=A0A6A1WTS8_9ROSI|nr:hypothetical protein CJ030_MR1G008765 [Morella rubra]
MATFKHSTSSLLFTLLILQAFMASGLVVGALSYPASDTKGLVVPPFGRSLHEQNKFIKTTNEKVSLSATYDPTGGSSNKQSLDRTNTNIFPPPSGPSYGHNGVAPPTNGKRSSFPPASGLNPAGYGF